MKINGKELSVKLLDKPQSKAEVAQAFKTMGENHFKNRKSVQESRASFKASFFK